ncbi:MAG: DUF1826 domain-containing protein [Pseudomonadota bacterium]
MVSRLHETPIVAQPGSRRLAEGSTPAVLADVFDEDVNIAVWQRELSRGIENAVDRLLASEPSLSASMTVSPGTAHASVGDRLGAEAHNLSSDIALLVLMFCELLGLRRAGLRLAVLDGAMCPKFHVDMVPCRLIATYCGPGTEWLPHDAVDRSKLGLGSRGLKDHESGLMESPDEIRKLKRGDVALLKGELWEGNHGAGLVHRSPAVASGDARLVLTLDVSG